MDEDFGGRNPGSYADDLESLGPGPSGRKGIPLSYCYMSLLGFPFKSSSGPRREGLQSGVARHGDGAQQLSSRADETKG